MTLLEVIKKLNTNLKCLKLIENIRWSGGVICPRCNGQKIITIRSRNKFECSFCKYQFNAIAGTIFSKTYVPLSKWMLAIHLFCSHEGEIKPAELSRILNLPYKTVWHLLDKIKENSKNYSFIQLAGLV